MENSEKTIAHMQTALENVQGNIRHIDTKVAGAMGLVAVVLGFCVSRPVLANQLRFSEPISLWFRIPELFLLICSDPDYTSLKINDNYGLDIVHRSGRIVPQRSAGYEHIVALSLIGALHKNAPMNGPVIMDSPFGRLSKTHKENVIKALPKMAEQVVLLAYSGEIDAQTARLTLGSDLKQDPAADDCN